MSEEEDYYTRKQRKADETGLLYIKLVLWVAVIGFGYMVVDILFL